MTNIKLLSQDVINKIAAGEIIERPGNIVKELVENSIDADATKITIEIKDAGKKIIRITDNGKGMNDEDLLLAFERHATSKISRIEDLYNLKTLGFRGEALPSIASISRVEVFTKPHGSNVGNYLRIEGGILKKIQPVNCNEGTVIIVKDLFYNTPARKKFLKSSIRETQFIYEIISRFMLGYPERQFTFISNNRVILKNNENDTLYDVLEIILGKEISGAMLEINHLYEDPYLNITGFISRPVISFPKGNRIYFLLNRRFVRSRLLTAAILESYRGYIMHHKYPSCILHINMPADSFDINVHPQKLDAKFSNEKLMFNRLKDAISNSLTSSHSNKIDAIPIKEPKITDKSINLNKVQSLFDNNNSTVNIQSPPTIQQTTINPEIIAEKMNFSSIKIIGQFSNSFILCEYHSDLIIIDQHAAHEKILYETLKDMPGNKFSSQPLLIPSILELSPNSKALLLDKKKELIRMGIKIEDFGGNSIKILEIPAFISQTESDILTMLLRENYEYNVDFLKDELLKKIACHRAVKENDTLREDEIMSLIKGMEKIKNPFFCPHGRPTILQLTKKRLERFFGRT